MVYFSHVTPICTENYAIALINDLGKVRKYEFPPVLLQLFYDCVLAIHEAKNQLLENIERADELLSRAPAPSIRGSNKSKRYSNGTSDDHDDDDTDSSRMRKKNMKLE